MPCSDAVGAYYGDGLPPSASLLIAVNALFVFLLVLVVLSIISVLDMSLVQQELDSSMTTASCVP
jgi:hypothetical protein